MGEQVASRWRSLGAMFRHTSRRGAEYLSGSLTLGDRSLTVFLFTNEQYTPDNGQPQFVISATDDDLETFFAPPRDESEDPF